MNDLIVKMTTKIVLPFIQLYGLYVIINGHLSPGGAFPGGAIFATSIVLFSIVFGLRTGKKRLPHAVSSKIETGGVFVFIVFGLSGIAMGYNFLTNQEAGFPMGEWGRILSAGFIPIITFALGLKVMSAVVTLFHTMMEEE